MPTTAQVYFNDALVVRPLEDYEDAIMQSVNFPASITYDAGSILGESSSTAGTAVLFDDSVLTAPVAPTLSDGGAGALGAGAYTLGITYITATGETTLGATAAITIAASHQINIAAYTPLPTGATGINVYMSIAAGSSDLAFVATNNGAAQTINSLPLAGALRAPRTNTAYVASNGAQTAKYILPYPVATDSAGNITMGSVAGTAPFAMTYLSLPVWVSGTFDTSQLKASGTGALDAKALTDLGAHYIYGSGATGAIRIG